jgi:hypothetical protein
MTTTETQPVKGITRYALAGLTNKVLKAQDLKEISPQQVYTMSKAGRIKTTRVGDQDLVSVEDAKAFIQSYVAGRLAKAAGTDEVLDEILAAVTQAA